jgi:hypothetical protein
MAPLSIHKKFECFAITRLVVIDNHKAFLFGSQIQHYGRRGSRPGYLLNQNERDNLEEIIMKKLVLAVAAIAILSGPVYAKTDPMHNKMVQMMQMIKVMKARNLQLERILQNMMDNLSSSHRG